MQNLDDSRDLNLRRKVRYSVGEGNLGAVQNYEAPWSRLCKMLSEPKATSEKFIEYQRAPDKTRAKLKNANGYWIGAHCETGRRKTNAIKERDVVCFDIDNGDLWPGDLVQALKTRTTAISDLEFFVHSSRSHTLVKPKLRLVFLLSKPVSAERYSAFVRILAHRLDPKMATVDPVSFRLAQMMFRPTISADMADHFIAFRNSGRLVDPDEVLASWPHPWSDYSKLPRGAHEKTLRQIAEKAENPLMKGGLVGAFCRTYSVPEAIDKFLPGVFVESDAPTMTSDARYKYVNSEGGPGAVLYDGGLFLYSHHGSDPYSDRLLNAWDLVRLHLYGEEDDDDEEYERISDAPSYKSMVELVKRDPGTKKTIAVENFSVATEMLGSVEDTAEPTESEQEDFDVLADLLGPSRAQSTEKSEPGLHEAVNALKGHDAVPILPASKDWLGTLELTDKLALKSTVQNLQIILANDPVLRGAFRRNSFTGNVDVCRDLIARSKTLPALYRKNTGRFETNAITDRHLTWVQAFLDDKTARDGGGGYGCSFGRNTIAETLELVANQFPYHPVIEWIDSKPWDGVERLETLFSKYAGAEDNVYTRAAAKTMMIAASARLSEPGLKFDYAVILEGAQGLRKSTFVSALANDVWFGELSRDVDDDRKVVENTKGRWFVELPELSAFGRREVEEVKDFISKTGVQARMAYGRYETSTPRQFVLAGTTNKNVYLKDDTGNRRFWPIKIGDNPIDIDGLREVLQQLHAEAMFRYREMRKAQPFGDLPLYLSDEEAVVIQNDLVFERSRDDAEDYMADRIKAWLERPVSKAEAYRELGLDYDGPDADVFGKRLVTSYVAIWIGALGGEAGAYHEGHAVRTRRACRGMEGWEDNGQRKIQGKRVRGIRSCVSSDALIRGEPWIPIEDPFELI